MDSWSNVQKHKLHTGGNRKFLEFIQNFRDRERLRSQSTASNSSHSQKQSESSNGVPNVTIMHASYINPEVVYYREILQAECDQRLAVPYDHSFWMDVVNPQKSAKHAILSKSVSPKWTDDEDAAECMLCAIPFTLFRRRHHCRRCGKCVCKVCAPPDNCRPILEWGMMDPVRHCKDCYTNPMLHWG